MAWIIVCVSFEQFYMQKSADDSLQAQYTTGTEC